MFTVEFVSISLLFALILELICIVLYCYNLKKENNYKKNYNLDDNIELYFKFDIIDEIKIICK